MAVIQKLRNSGIVVIVIIAALVLFVLGDLLTGSKITGLNQEEQDVVGEAFGDKIRERDIDPVFKDLVMQQAEQNPNFQLDEATRKQMIEQAWSTLIRQKTYEAQIEKSNVKISDEDFNEMTMGENPMEAIKGDPSFQTNNKFDPAKVSQVFAQAKRDASLRTRLVTYIKNLKKQELETRYTHYISKAQVKSKVEKEAEYVGANQGVVGKVVALNYSTVADKDVKVTDKDLESYLKEHKEEYKQTYESRDISYVVWDIVPSSEDTAYAKTKAEEVYLNWSKETKPDTAGEEVVAFKSIREIGTDSAQRAMYAPLASIANNALLPVMTIDGKYNIVQKLDTKVDTANPYVKVAHILIPFGGELPNKTQITDTAAAQALANELLAKINAGASIADLAKDYSADPGSANTKGEYDWAPASKYVPEFGKFCATHGKGATGIVKTSFGFHVMKMSENPEALKVKYRQRAIEVAPGAKTISLVQDASRNFRNAVMSGDLKSFEKNRDKMGLAPLVRKGIKTEDRMLGRINNAEDVKSILFWLFDKDRKNTDISDVFAFSTSHAVLMVTNVRHRGYATIEDVREIIEPLVRNELKADKIREKFEKAIAGGAKTAEEIASKTGGQVVPLEGVKLGSNFIPQLFTEPRILGAAFGVKEKSWSKAIAGNNVVAVLYIESRDKVEIPKTGIDNGPDFANNPQFLANRLQETVRAAAELQDYRYKFPWD